MGFSVRDQTWRYTAWMPFNGTRAWWADGPSTEELYAHDYPLSTMSMDEMGEKVNLAYLPEYKDLTTKYYKILRNFFEKVAPPTAPATSEYAVRGHIGIIVRQLLLELRARTHA